MITVTNETEQYDSRLLLENGLFLLQCAPQIGSIFNRRTTWHLDRHATGLDIMSRLSLCVTTHRVRVCMLGNKIYILCVLKC